jgi:hypothetical protein
VLPTKLSGEPLKPALIGMWHALRSNFGMLKLLIEKYSLLTKILDVSAGLIRIMVMSVKALKQSAILVCQNSPIKKNSLPTRI